MLVSCKRTVFVCNYWT